MNNLSKYKFKWLFWFHHIFVTSQKNIFMFAFDMRFQLRFLSESQITQWTCMWPFFLMHLHNVSFHMIIWLELFITQGALYRFYFPFMKFSDMGLHRIFIWKTFLTNRTFMCNSLMDWADMFFQRCFPLKLFSTKIAQMAWIKDLLRSERNTLLNIIQGLLEF